jgi:CRISPR-associated protein Csd1
MILSSLVRYYDSRSREENDPIPQNGFSKENISFSIVISTDGELVAIRDLRVEIGKKVLPIRLLVPAAVKRSRGFLSNFLWDNLEYVLGIGSKNPERIKKAHEIFKDAQIKKLENVNDLGVQCFLSFLRGWRPDKIERSEKPIGFMEGGNVVFEIENLPAPEGRYLHERPVIQSLLGANDPKDKEAICLITGRREVVKRLHPAIKGVFNAKSSGTNLISFNAKSFESYGKEQNFNAPIGATTVFKYSTGLNDLLKKNSSRKALLDEATVIFWAEESSGEEDSFSMLFGKHSEEKKKSDADLDPIMEDRITTALKALRSGNSVTEAIHSSFDRASLNKKFYILGLSPNASRFSVRFWSDNTLERSLHNLLQHHADFGATGTNNLYSLYRVVATCGVNRKGEGKSENIPPQLIGQLTQAVLFGERYPRSLLINLIARIRAGEEINPVRAATIRAIIHRDFRLRFNKEDASMSLDKDNTNPGYLLGRLFCRLEKIQRQALGEHTNTTIRDSYYSTASANPASVFPILLRKATNHLGKLRKEGKGGWSDRRVSEIIDKLSGEIPKSLRLVDQGLFALGYYHERSEKKEESELKE